ncbi:carboxylesterase/lipase family protein [Caulobacter mirabilis]|uniref:carboxylesterase/lipase family protein n=1 Tax=Caulobacter mirabilis TaxID=69666 RepID=UPI001558DD10|nr:carboxylesterase family protein [Caulobacter mirabilis]
MSVSSRSQSSRRMLSLLAGVAVLAAACAQPAASQQPAGGQAVEAQVETGALRGRQADGVKVFKGIPYAAPPVGDLRWRAPAKAAAWQGVREADRFGFDCIQNKPGWDPTQSKEPQNEDCLTVNVWAPERAAKAPVMVWIHGGGYVMGSGSQALFDGAKLAKRGVIVVTFNYRLGRFGFFAHPALTAEAGDAPVGNYGYMDQIAALEWVKRNISAFGGDPAQVTIFGESAGGGSVNQHMLMAPSRGLFARAIAQSGGGRDALALLSQDRPTKPSAETVGKAFAVKAGVTGNDLAALRALPAKTLLGNLDLLNMEDATYSGPFIDGRLVTSNAVDGFAAGKQAKVPYLVGANSDEMGVIPALFRGGLVSKALKQIDGDTAGVEAAYGSKSAMNDRFLSDFNFVEPARRLAGFQAQAGAPTWLYSFGYVPEAKRKSLKGAPHASELAFVFGNLSALDVKTTPADEAAATLVGDYWTTFAKGGDPNGSGRATWPAYGRAADTLLSFTNDGPAAAKPDAGPLDAIGKLQTRP